jgi:serine/threonine protein kinase
VIGQRVNNYEIKRLVGSGAMGAVYEAEHPIIRRKVAVKVLQNQLIRDPVAVQRFFAEARMTSAIRHPHIVEIIDVGTLRDGVPYLIMELLEGETLACRLERVGRLDVAGALNIVLQAATALEAAHDHGVIHRDLKPEHLFLMPDQRLPGEEMVKVLDFGIAKLRGTPPSQRVATHSGTVMGTPLYMSPEQCSGISSAVDQRTDIYALGVILYEVLCGQPPFLAAGIGDIFMMHTARPPAPPSVHRPDLPARVEQIVLTALAKRPDHRFASMADLAAAIRAARASTQRFVSPTNEPFELPVRTGAARGERISEASRSAFRSTPVLEHSPSKPPGGDTQKSAIESSPLGPTQVRSRSKRSFVLRALGALFASVALVLVVRGGWHRGSEPSPQESNGAAPPLPQATIEAAPGPPPPPALQSEPRVEPAVTAAAGAAAVQKKPSSSVHAVSGTAEASGATGAAGAANTGVASVGVPANTSSGGATNTSSAGSVNANNGASSSGAASPATTALPIPPRKAADVSLEPAPAAPAPTATDGYLSLDSAPWAEVYLGSKLLGSTPLLHVALAPGKHELTLKNPELHRMTTYVVEVKAGSSVSRFVGWEKEGR